MRGVRFRREAAEDLRAIREYFLAFDESTADRVLADIERGIDLVRSYPFAGPQIPQRRFRRLVTRHYGIKIAYIVLDEAIEVIGLFRFQDRKR